MRGRAGLVYHVGTGRSRRVGDGLDRLVRLSGRTVKVKVDPALLKVAAGPPTLAPTSTASSRHTGWHPTISWEQSLDGLVDATQSRAARRLSPTGGQRHRTPFTQQGESGWSQRLYQATSFSSSPRWARVRTKY